jgi:hypothetical protein
MKSLFLMCAVTVVLTIAAPSQAALIDFHADMIGSNEVPPNASRASGPANFALDTAAGTLSVVLGFAGLSPLATGAHIHCCTGPGMNAPIVLPFSSADSFPFGVTGGSFVHTYDLSTSLTGISVADFLAGLEAGQAYANIHTSIFPGGEIRGQIIPTIPEISTWAMMFLGFASVGYMTYRRRKQHTAFNAI